MRYVNGAAESLVEPGGVAPALAALLALGLALVHLGAGRLRLAGRIPRSRWLSFAGGTAIAYVFVHLLPELEAAGRAIEASETVPLVLVERHVYLIALAGFGAFYGLERLVTRSRETGVNGASGGLSTAGVFWVHVGSFAVYNVLIGYSLSDRESARAAVLFAIAMGFHFVVNDAGFRGHHAGRYDRFGRWLLAIAVLVGAGLGIAVDVDEVAVAAILAFLGGGVILNVIKEELPEERESRFGSFAVGAVSYATVLLLV